MKLQLSNGTKTKIYGLGKGCNRIKHLLDIMERRIKYVYKKKNNSWYYAVQVKIWLFWKTIYTDGIFTNIKKFIDTLNQIDDFKGYHRLEEGRVKICNDITCLFLDKENDKTIYELWLSHFPMMTWPHRESKRCYQLFGHIHSGERRDKSMMDQDLPLHSNQFDVGVDNWNYKPVEVNEFLK